MTQTLSKDELIFATRMLPHVLAGMSYEDAARAVLVDDERLFAAFCDQSHSHYIPTPDERGRAHQSGTRPGDLITQELARIAYNHLTGECLNDIAIYT